ncbi:MAG: hypothetical protein LBU89_09305 [Fibromonadaceae bacterium]|nr:hypothetical protein [Fibromonadaceae bacterium]
MDFSKIKTIIFVFCFVFTQSIFADVCDFTVVESSGETTVFHFNDMENDSEYEKLKKFPHAVEITIKGQLLECEKYKKYKEYLKDIEWMDQFIRCLDKEESCD